MVLVYHCRHMATDEDRSQTNYVTGMHSTNELCFSYITALLAMYTLLLHPQY